MKFILLLISLIICFSAQGSFSIAGMGQSTPRAEIPSFPYNRLKSTLDPRLNGPQFRILVGPGGEHLTSQAYDKWQGLQRQKAEALFQLKTQAVFQSVNLHLTQKNPKEKLEELAFEQRTSNLDRRYNSKVARITSFYDNKIQEIMKKAKQKRKSG